MKEIWSLIALPFANKTAGLQFFYLVFFVALLGNAGSIIEVFNYYQNGKKIEYLDNFANAFILFSIPIIGVSSANLLLGKHSKFLALFSIVSIFIIIILSLLFLFGSFFTRDQKNIFGFLMMIFSLFFWWIANGASEIFQDVSPDVSVGGDPSRDLDGDISDFEV